MTTCDPDTTFAPSKPRPLLGRARWPPGPCLQLFQAPLLPQWGPGSCRVGGAGAEAWTLGAGGTGLDNPLGTPGPRPLALNMESGSQSTCGHEQPVEPLLTSSHSVPGSRPIGVVLPGSLLSRAPVARAGGVPGLRVRAGLPPKIPAPRCPDWGVGGCAVVMTGGFMNPKQKSTLNYLGVRKLLLSR